MEMFSLQSFYRVLVIFLLNERGLTGYEIISSIGERVGKKPSNGKIYPFLNKLEDLGVVRLSKEDEDGRCRGTYYLTDKGRKLHEDLVHRLKNIFLPYLTNSPSS